MSLLKLFFFFFFKSLEGSRAVLNKFVPKAGLRMMLFELRLAGNVVGVI